MWFLWFGCVHPVVEPAATEADLLRARAAGVTITRDTWGIAHVRARTDADAVFGMVYAQAEDDFPRIERNYLVALGRLAEVEGESAWVQDLRARLYVDPADLQARYAGAPEWLKRVLEGWADGLNFYLATHPEVRPRALTAFEPWMALAFPEGSIGGDIERISLDGLRAFYEGGAGEARLVAPEVPGQSNGIAIGPRNTANGAALLLINPHTSFYFRDELQVTSDEGLNVYGAVTWGQPFVYQGFNERCGWMHTSSEVDAVDEFLEEVSPSGGGFVYRYGDEVRPIVAREVVIRVKTDAGLVDRAFTVYRTHRGPIVGVSGDRWVSVAMSFDPVRAVTQSFLRNKARDLAAFRATLDLHTNASNNTVYADADGHYAYFHANFIPRREDRFDYTRPVDGADPATDWGPPISVDESPNAIDPPTGWVFSTNNWPYGVAGPASPRRSDFPSYVDRGTQNDRAAHAEALLAGRTDWTLDALREAAFDRALPAFDRLLPPLFAAYDALPRAAPERPALAEPIALLRGWDRRWATDSAATTLAITWAEALPDAPSAADRVAALGQAVGALTAATGDWRVPWGDVNRFQRISAEIEHPFSDRAPSVPVGFTEGRWGSLAVFAARPYAGTRARYGTEGNSFVAVVEFGDRVRAVAVTAGGVSGDPSSPHFADQVDRYVRGDLREVWFYPEDLAGHVEREYSPGADGS